MAQLLPRTILARPRVVAAVAISRQLVMFAIVGGLATFLFFGVYNTARLALPAFASNAAAVVVSSLANFAANRRFTFGRRGRTRAVRQLIEFALVLGVTLAISTGALALLFALRPGAGVLHENIAILVGTGALFLVRFWLLRGWVFHPDR